MDRQIYGYKDSARTSELVSAISCFRLLHTLSQSHNTLNTQTMSKAAAGFGLFKCPRKHTHRISKSRSDVQSREQVDFSKSPAHTIYKPAPSLSLCWGLPGSPLANIFVLLLKHFRLIKQTTIEAFKFFASAFRVFGENLVKLISCGFRSRVNIHNKI